MIRRVLDLLREPRLSGVEVDGDELLTLHRDIMLNKTIMRQVSREFYETCLDLDLRYLSGHGHRVEIGAGASLFKHFYPSIVSMDIKFASHLDVVGDALQMPFRDGSVRAFYGINCFHHFPDPDLFFKELQRTLVDGGGCILIDPYYGPVASRFYKRLFETEEFDRHQAEWAAPTGAMGFMRGANQALSYIVFVRDRARFDAKYPGLTILRRRPLKNYLRSVVSGGLNFRPLLPAFLAPAVKACEFALAPLSGVLALHHVIALRKRAV